MQFQWELVKLYIDIAKKTKKLKLWLENIVKWHLSKQVPVLWILQFIDDHILLEPNMSKFKVYWFSKTKAFQWIIVNSPLLKIQDIKPFYLTFGKDW